MTSETKLALLEADTFFRYNSDVYYLAKDWSLHKITKGLSSIPDRSDWGKITVTTLPTPQFKLTIEELSNGKEFYYGNTKYMKTYSADVNRNYYNAVSLKNGLMVKFDDKTPVELEEAPF